MREVSKSYGIYGPGQGGAQSSAKGKEPQGWRDDKRQGSEYLVINVKNGTSRVKLDGTSLVNFANAYTVIEVVARMLAQSIDPTGIKILSYYQGQRRLLGKLLNAMNPETDRYFTAEAKAAICSQPLTISSFSYIYIASNIVIVDMVAAKDIARLTESKNKPIKTMALRTSSRPER